jgi:tetratricopeptide (TPR) repeat protein
MTGAAPTHRLILLGGAVIRSGVQPLGGPAAHRHRLALLALLAASPAPVSRDKLIAFLWPERDTESGRNLLKVAVHELRKLLGEHALRSTGDQLSIDPSALSCDLIDLDAAAASGDDARIVELYAGPFLDGFHLKDSSEFEHWVDGQRARLERIRAEALARVSDTPLPARPFVEATDKGRSLAQPVLRSASDEGLRTTRSDNDGRPFTRRRLTKRSVIGVVTAVGLTVAITTTIGFVVNKRIDEKNATSNALAVVPFRVVGSDSSLSDGMMEMLVARIGDDGPLRAVEARFSTRPTGTDQVPIAIQQGKVVGAGKVLVGDVVGGGGRGDVDDTATIYNVADAAVVGRASRTIASGASIPATIDTLAAELMVRASDESVDRLPDLTRRPLPALRLYLAAQTEYRHGAYQRAESLFAKALEVDSSFALAGLGLALANSWTTINDHYGLGRDVALRNMKDLSARDRLFIAAFFGPDPLLGDPKPAPVYLQAWEDVVHKHPDFAEAWYHVGDRYYHFGGLSGLADPLDQARTEFRRALSIDSSLVAPLHHLIEIYASRGEVEEARVTAARYFANNPAVSRDASAIGWTVATVTKDERWLARVRGAFTTMPLADLSRIAWITQENGWAVADADSALSVLERRAGATFEKSAAYGVRYAFSLNAGRIAAARAAAAGFEAQVPDQPIGALWGVYAVMFAGADTAGFGEHVRALAAFGTSPLSGNPDRRARQVQARCLVGYAKLGQRNPAGAAADLAAVRRMAADEDANSIQRREGEMCVGWLGAAIAVEMNAGDAAAKIGRLDTMVLRDRVPPRMSLSAMAVLAARLHERRGELKEALAASRWREHYTGDPMFLSTQLRIEAEVARKLGDTAAAARAERRYLALRR